MNENDIIQLINKIRDDLRNIDLDLLWRGFCIFPFALYDSNNVYMTDIENDMPGFTKIEQNVYKGDWDNNFFGNSAIKYKGNIIAIWNIDLMKKNMRYAKVFSGIVHEMYHANQLHNKENRFANELQLIDYPFNIDNISLRLKERESILRALFADSNGRGKYIDEFVSIREKRIDMIGQYMDYEMAMESIEGTAFYTEARAYKHITGLPEKFVDSQYTYGLYPESVDLRTLRKSCFPSGYGICRLLDMISGDWQDDYSKSDKYLYEFMKENISYRIKDIEIPHSEFAKNAVNYLKDYIDEEFQSFEETEEPKIIIKGDFHLKGFNPMNVVSDNRKILHHDFLIIGYKDKSISIKQPVISFHEESISNIYRIEFFVSELPQVSEDSILIKGIEELNGRISESGDGVIVELE